MTICDLHRQMIFLTARACVGGRFRHQGRHPDGGLDCVGLIFYVAKSLGLSDFDRRNYKKIPAKNAISRHIIAAGYKARPISDMIPGDVLVMRIGRYLEHTAILSDRGIIHACEKYGGVVEHGLDQQWRSRIISVHSFPNI